MYKNEDIIKQKIIFVKNGQNMSKKDLFYKCGSKLYLVSFLGIVTFLPS